MIKRFLVDNRSKSSLAHRLRSRRFAHLLDLMSDLPSPVRLLDVGGTPTYWQQMGVDFRGKVEVTVLNVDYDEHAPLPDGVRLERGDARDLSRFGEGSFDVVFSNSVIEHVGGFDDQRRMASEIRRVSRRYLVQTPNFFFPVEPHFVFPLFQYFPIPLRVWLVRTFPIAWSGRINDADRAREAVMGIRLLRRSQLRELFPDGEAVPERFFGLVKSWMMVRRNAD